MKGIWGFVRNTFMVTALVFFCTTSIKATGYDSTYVLSVKQKYAIPEKVSNGDYVDYWKKTITWRPKGTINYAIEKNFNNAFAINSTSGLITITDASKINGKIVKQDTIINLLIKTTDSKIGYEIDTAQILVKESAYCIFIDYSYKGSVSTGSISQPYKDLDNFSMKVGYGYFLKRGVTIKYENTIIRSLISSKDHPLIIGAYGKGGKPVFLGDGGVSGSKSECFYLGTYKGDASIERAENVHFYSIIIRKYGSAAYKSNRITKNIGWYNCEVYNNSILTQGPAITLNDQTYADSTLSCPFEFINLVSDSLPASLIKAGAGPLIVINAKANGNGRIRMACGNGGIIKHSYIQTDKSDGSTIQVRGDRTIIEDVIINHCSYGIDLTSPGYASNSIPFVHMPDKCLIKNVLVSDFSGYAIGIWKPDKENRVPTGDIIEDCLFAGNTGKAIRINSGSNIVIRRNFIMNAGDAGIHIQGGYPIQNITLDYNIITGKTKEGIVINNGSNFYLYNNTVNSNINLEGATNEIAKNNFYKSITSCASSSNNVQINSDILTSHFVNYSINNYHLKNTSLLAINKGVLLSFQYDYCGHKIDGNPDIGAYELVNESSTPVQTLPVETENSQPVIYNQTFIVNEENFTSGMIGKVKAEDQDESQKLSYEILSGTYSDLFTINDNTGDIYAKDNNIFAPGTISYNLDVKVIDDATSPKAATANITVTLNGISKVVYIDPENVSDNLSNGSKQHPFKSWSNIVWHEGYTYLQKRGTSANVDKLVIGSNNILLGAYGEGDLPIINSTTNTYLISGFEKNNITIEYINLSAPNAISCIYILGSTSDRIIVKNCAITAKETAIKVVDGVSLIVKYNKINSEQEGINSTTKFNEVYYNFFKNCNTAINIVSTQSDAKVFNNVFFDNNQSISTSYADLTLYNNIFYMTSVAQKAINHGTGNLTSNNNIYYPEQANFVKIGNNSYKSLDELQSSLKIDLNSFTSDPLFKDVIAGDFSLTENSPAINAGKNTDIKTDITGMIVPFQEITDIGMNEYNILKNTNQQKSNETNVQIYPNPTNGPVNIFAEILNNNDQTDPVNIWPELYITDMAGKVVFTKKIINNSGTTIQDFFDLSEIKNGIYIIILQWADRVIKEKLVLSK